MNQPKKMISTFDHTLNVWIKSDWMQKLDIFLSKIDNVHCFKRQTITEQSFLPSKLWLVYQNNIKVDFFNFSHYKNDFHFLTIWLSASQLLVRFSRVSDFDFCPTKWNPPFDFPKKFSFLLTLGSSINEKRRLKLFSCLKCINLRQFPRPTQSQLCSLKFQNF